MKKTIILSLCALAALACAKEVAPVAEMSGEGVVVPAVIEATIDDTKLGLDGSLNLFWQEGDLIHCRMSSASWTAAGESDTFTAVKEGENVIFKGNLTYSGLNNAFLFASADGKYSGTGSSIFLYDWKDNQSGDLNDLADYTIMWGNVDKAVNPIVDNGNNTYNIKVAFNPMFCLLKFNIADGLKVAKVVVKGDADLGGQLTIQSSRLGNPGPSFGSGGFAFYSSSATATLFKEITIYRYGDEISGDVYVSICPNSYNNGEYENNLQNLTLSFYNENEELLGEYSRKLTTPLKNAQVKNLGSITTFEKKEADEFKPSLTFKRSDDTKDFLPIFVGTAHETLLAKGVKFYYTISSESMDAAATPTTSSTEIPETGVPVSTSTAYDCQFVKVLATCPGFADVYFKATVRNWRLRKDCTTESSNGLVFDDGYDSSSGLYLKTPLTSSAGNYKIYMTAKAIAGGNTSLFLKGHVGSQAKDFNLYVGDYCVLRMPCSASAYTSDKPACMISDSAVATVGTDLKIEMDVPTQKAYNFYVWDFAVIEQEQFTPVAATQAKASVDALTNGTQYNF